MSVLGLDLGRARVTTQDGAGGVVSGVCFELTMDDGSRQTLSAAMLAPLLVGGAPPALVAALEPPPASSSVTDCFASSCLDAAHDAAHEPLPFNKEEDVTVVVPTATALSVDGGRAAAAAAGGAPAPAPSAAAARALRAPLLRAAGAELDAKRAARTKARCMFWVNPAYQMCARAARARDGRAPRRARRRGRDGS